MTGRPGGLSYRQVKQTILERIRSGDLAPGALIPGEQSLAEEFGCARATVNRALQELASDGIVERRRKAGTRVVSVPTVAARFEIPLVRREIEASGAQYLYELLEHGDGGAPKAVAERLSMNAGDPVVFVRCLHLADGHPYQLEERWINLASVPAAADQSFERESPNEWLVREVPFTSAEHTFTAVNASAEEARLLSIDPGAALFVVERRTWIDGNGITWTRLLHPGNTYRLVSRGRS